MPDRETLMWCRRTYDENTMTFRNRNELQKTEKAVEIIQSLQVDHEYVRSRVRKTGYLCSMEELESFTGSGETVITHGPFAIGVARTYVNVYLRLTEEQLDWYLSLEEGEV